MRKFVANTGGAIGNLDELPTHEDLPLEMQDDLAEIYDSLQNQNSDVKKILDQLKRWLKALRISSSLATQFPYQTLVTSGSNLTSGTLHGRTRTQSVLTTTSTSPQQFDWRKSKRENLVVVGPGDGVEPHLFGVNPDPQYWGGAWGYSANGEIVQRNGLVMPYADGTSRQLIFFEFDSTDNYLPKPVDLGIGTTIYLQQRLPGE